MLSWNLVIAKRNPKDYLEKSPGGNAFYCESWNYSSCFMIFSGEIRIGGQEHFYMETQSMLVVPVGEEMELNIYVSTQSPTLIQVHRVFITTN